MSGKSLVNTGESARERACTMPPRSPIFIMPSQSESTPVRPREISNAVLAEENVESMIAGKTVVSPNTSSFTTAMTKAMTKNATQI